ncbi:MAG: hypothetical protein QM692_24940 [Thermomicrobiales bacterium]
MTEAQPKPDAAPRRGAARSLTIAATAILVLLVIAGAAGWRVYSQRAAVPDWDERLTTLNLLAPAGDAFDDATPWVSLILAPGTVNTDVPVTLRLENRQGTPTPTDANAPIITAATLQPLGGSPTPLTLASAPDGSATSTVRFPTPGWWRITAETSAGGAPATYDFVVPDPNIAGPAAAPSPQTQPDAEALYRQGLEALTTLQSVHYVQWMADGKGNAAISEHTVGAPTADKPAEFLYRAAGGMEAILIGDTRWVQLPNNLGWTKQEGAFIVPPSEWGEEYAGATHFASIGTEEVDGVSTQIISFVVPEVLEPQRQTAAWYTWWIDPATGHILREAMVSRSHYMLNHFSDYDVPLNLTPPDMDAGAATPAATPASGTDALPNATPAG